MGWGWGCELPPLHHPHPFAAKKPVSPYSGYNGQLLTSVYQPTEMALMHKGPVSADTLQCHQALWGWPHPA